MTTDDRTGIDTEYLENRANLATLEEKEKQDWGDEMASKLWKNFYSKHSPLVDDATILDIGCSWGYLLKYLNDNFSPSKLIGTDILPWWESTKHGWDYQSLGDKLQLIANDLTAVDEIPEESVDLVMCTSVLQYLTPENVEANMAKAYSLLKPGGEMILRTRVWTSYIGADLHRDITLPYAHLLYSQGQTSEILAKKGIKAKYLNWLDSSTYLFMFTRVGFEVIDVNRRMNSRAPEIATRVLEKFPWIPSSELQCAELEARLLRPFED